MDELNFDGANALTGAGAAAKSKPSSLFSNSLAMGIANLAGRGLSYCYIVLLARHLNTVNLGCYALLLTTSMLMELVSNLGLDKILTREITKCTPEIGQGYFLAAIPIRLAMGGLSIIPAWVLLHVFFGHLLLLTPYVLTIFLLGVFPLAGARNCEALLVARERLLPVALSQFCERVVMFAAVLLVITNHISFAGLLCIAPFAACTRLSVVAFVVASLWQTRVPNVWPRIRTLLRQGLQLFSVDILALVYFRSDIFFVAKLGSLSDAGIYQITYKIFDVCISLFTGSLQAAFPRLVRDKSSQTLTSMILVGTSLLTLPVTVIIAFRHFILGTLRPEFLAGSNSLVWLMLTVPLVYINSLLANMAIVANRIRLLLIMASLLFTSNIVLNILLIPTWSLNGAAFSTFVCELLSCIILGPFILQALRKTGGMH